MKTNHIAVLYFAASLFTLSITSSCTDNKDGKENKNTQKGKSTNVKKPVETDNNGLKIGFIDMDSVSNNYEYQKDVKALLEANQKKAENTLKAKENTFQTRYASYQKKVMEFQKKANNIKSEAEQRSLEAEANSLKNEEAALAKLEQEYQTENAKLTQEFQELFTKHTQEFNDTIENFLQEYGEENGYDLLLGKSSTSGGVLYGKEAYDATDDVIKALNDRYASYKKK